MLYCPPRFNYNTNIRSCNHRAHELKLVEGVIRSNFFISFRAREGKREERFLHRFLVIKPRSKVGFLCGAFLFFFSLLVQYTESKILPSSSSSGGEIIHSTLDYQLTRICIRIGQQSSWDGARSTLGVAATKHANSAKKKEKKIRKRSRIIHHCPPAVPKHDALPRAFRSPVSPRSPSLKPRGQGAVEVPDRCRINSGSMQDQYRINTGSVQPFVPPGLTLHLSLSCQNEAVALTAAREPCYKCDGPLRLQRETWPN